MNVASIRAAKRDELGALVRLYRESAEHHQRLDPALYRIPEPAPVAEWLEAVLSSPGAAIFAAEAAGEVIGFAVIRRAGVATGASMLQPRRGVELDVTVSPPFRRQGVGTALADAACAWAASQDCQFVMLNCHVDNRAAVRLYESAHFRTVGLLMRRDLP